MLKCILFQTTYNCWFISKYVHYLLCQTFRGGDLHKIYKSGNAFPITLLCIAMATKRRNQPRWKHFQGWSLMAKIIAETYTSPKQTTSRVSNAWSVLSSTVSHQHRLPCEHNTPKEGRGFGSQHISVAGPALGRAGPEFKRQGCCASDFSEIHLDHNDSILVGMLLLGWHQTLPLE